MCDLGSAAFNVVFLDAYHFETFVRWELSLFECVVRVWESLLGGRSICCLAVPSTQQTYRDAWRKFKKHKVQHYMGADNCEKLTLFGEIFWFVTLFLSLLLEQSQMGCKKG